MMLTVLLLRLCALPFRACAFCGVPLGLEGMFHVTFEGVVGREGGDVMGW